MEPVAQIALPFSLRLPAPGGLARRGCSMSAMKAKLLVIQGRPQGKSLVFAPGSYYFGRGEECQVRPNSAMVSRQHCLLRVTETGVYLKDLGSRHGTLINGTLIQQEQQLSPGDQVQIGPLVFELQLGTMNDAPAPPVILGPAPLPNSETLPEFTVPDVPESTAETDDHPSLDESDK